MKFLFILIAGILFNGCHPLFCEWNSDYSVLTQEPDLRDVIGIYELTDDSKYNINSSYSVWSKTIELKEDGTWIRRNEKEERSRGTWKIYFGKSFGCMIDFNPEDKPIKEKDGVLAILFTIGDGDNCEGVVYEKIK